MNENTNGNTKNGIDQNNIQFVDSIAIPIEKPIEKKKDRPQNKNLISLATRTKEERQEIGRKGGLKSGESRKARKTLKESILAMMTQELAPKKLEEMGIDTATLNGDYTMQNAVISAMFREALNGDTKAAQLLRDTIDEAPTTRQEVRQEIISKDDLKTIDNLKQYLTG